MSKQYPVITVDGPSGTGKGTVSQIVAKELGWNLLDSGALYRVLGEAARQHAVDLDNEAALEVLAAHLDVQFLASNLVSATRVILEGEDVTDVIRTESCGNDASQIAALPGVRKALLLRQRAFAQAPGLVTDGRDMGTVVFPQAVVKVYLDASCQERAQRRYLQLKEKGINATLAQVLGDLSKRDERDSCRKVAPLKPADDAVRIDTTKLSIEEVVQNVLELVRMRVPSLEEV